MSLVTTLVANFVKEAVVKLALNPTDVENFGIKNIHYYRNLFTVLWTKAGKKEADLIALFQILINQKTEARINEALTVQTSIAAVQEVKEAADFLRNHCVASTPLQKPGKIATVKIPDSFPEICVLLYVVSYRDRKPEELADQIIEKMWSASIAWAPDEQNRNQVAVKAAWDSWGKTSGKKKNSLGDIISFDAEIYENQRNDKIRLVDENGVEESFQVTVGGANIGVADGYNKERLIAYIGKIILASSKIAVPRAVAIA